jgi:NADH-quinone oxidoreductase subunit G
MTNSPPDTLPLAFLGKAPGEVAAQKAGDQVTLTIDGRSITMPKGANVLEAARKLGIAISAFCYHPGLSIAAVCRQCLVKVEKSPKLVPSCQAICQEGMVVSTVDAEAVDARRQMLEFTLVNHPIDCPICDKAGECTLQSLYFDHDHQLSRADVPKVRKPKVVDIGEHIVLDAERCILCTRCIRVCDEVAGSHQLDMAFRNDHQELQTAPGERLDNPYSLNTVDVCPVGALTAKDFRFAMRAWQLMMTPSVCAGCATGCNVEIHHREGRAYRLVPRYNAAVNKHWMCDDGRFSYKTLHKNRLAAPLVDGLPESWERALKIASAVVWSARSRDTRSFGVVLSPHASNEANYILFRLARDFWRAGRLYVAGADPVPARADGILRDADVTPNRTGVRAILGDAVAGDTAALAADLLAGRLEALVVLGHEAALAEDALAALGAVALVALATSEGGLVAHANVALPVGAWAEEDATFTNRQGHVQRLRAAFAPVGRALPAWEVLVRLAQSTDAASQFPSARAVFDEMKRSVPQMAAAAWGQAAPIVQLRFAHSRG